MRFRYLRTVWLLSFIIGVPRLAAFWLLLTLEAAGKQSISHLPLVLLLYPEGLFVPQTIVWTIGSVLKFSGLLLTGSIIFSLLVAAFMFFLRKG